MIEVADRVGIPMLSQQQIAVVVPVEVTLLADLIRVPLFPKVRDDDVAISTCDGKLLVEEFASVLVDLKQLIDDLPPRFSARLGSFAPHGVWHIVPSCQSKLELLSQLVVWTCLRNISSESLISCISRQNRCRQMQIFRRHRSEHTERPEVSLGKGMRHVIPP
jgi:hypothetical protein